MNIEDIRSRITTKEHLFLIIFLSLKAIRANKAGNKLIIIEMPDTYVFNIESVVSK